MVRLMGILTGSAIAVAILILMLGVPEISMPPDSTVPAIETQVEVGKYRSVAVTDLPVPQATAPDTEALVKPVPAEPLFPEPPEADAETPPPEFTDTAVPTERPPEEIKENWYAFWSPFRSEIAADGFITELQRTTGLDYRVVKLKPGVYEVAFAYSDDSDIQDKLTRISTATGLDLSGG